MRRFAVGLILLMLCIAISPSALAANVVYVGSADADSASVAAVRAAAQFYGLEVITLSAKTSRTALLEHLRDVKTVALVVDAGALGVLDRSVLSASRGQARRIAVLVAGIHETSDPSQLKLWSGGVVTGVATFNSGKETASYSFADLPDLTRQLGTMSLATTMHAGPFLTTASGADDIIRAKAGAKQVTVFARTHVDGSEVFFAAQGPRFAVPVTADPYRQQPIFASLAPEMIFLRHAAGDQAWHTPGNYANLTIDDAWLREPYGHVNYEGLLHEMEAHRFHTTAAFIPWNFDRSQPAMVALFAAHPELYSICIHGNNHVHQEFGPLASHPLPRQAGDIRQAVARMEMFHTLTGIPYDRVMVFPHSMAPRATLAELKKANYLATANSLNVPSDGDATSALGIALRTTTLQYANFPSMRRYSAENDIPTAQLAIDAFLGNPILLYVHEAYFAGGIDRFDAVADTVNRLDPATRWKGLGFIARHSYVERTGNSGDDMEVRLLTATAEFHNQETHPVRYTVDKAEDFSSPITVLLDGESVPYEKKDKGLQLAFVVAGGQTRQVTIEYGSPLNLAAIDISKSSLSIAMIRRLSDFRDDVVSNSALGRRFIHSYADNSSIWQRSLVALVILCVAGLLALRSKRRSRAATPLVDSVHSAQ